MFDNFTIDALSLLSTKHHFEEKKLQFLFGKIIYHLFIKKLSKNVKKNFLFFIKYF